MNDICLFHVSYAQQLQLLHLVLVCEKEVLLVHKSGTVVIKTNIVTSSYKTDTSMVKSDMLQNEKSELEKGAD